MLKAFMKHAARYAGLEIRRIQPQHDLERLYRGEEQPQFNGQFDLVFCLGVLYRYAFSGHALPRKWRRRGRDLFTPWPAASMPLFHRGGISDPTMGMSPKSVWPFEARSSRPDSKLRIPDYPCSGQGPPKWDPAHHVASSGVKLGSSRGRASIPLLTGFAAANGAHPTRGV
jgi:hypothetical protein